MLSLKRTALSLSLALSLFTSAQAAEYRPQALSELVQRVEVAASRGETPIVMFDLDDTLINTRERNRRIYRQFAAQSDVQKKYPEDAARLAQVEIPQIHYLLTDTLQELGINNPALAQEATAFWLSRFFTNEYSALDQPNPGAVKYVRKLIRAGATVVYLTGRDVPRMGAGTEAALKLQGFPNDGARAKLLLKPDPKIDDLAFKISQFETVGKMGTVVGLFENEPANINAMAQAFPAATAIFLDTIHSPKPDTVQDGVFWVKDFHETAAECAPAGDVLQVDAN